MKLLDVLLAVILSLLGGFYGGMAFALSYFHHDCTIQRALTDYPTLPRACYQQCDKAAGMPSNFEVKP